MNWNRGINQKYIHIIIKSRTISNEQSWRPGPFNISGQARWNQTFGYSTKSHENLRTSQMKFMFHVRIPVLRSFVVSNKSCKFCEFDFDFTKLFEPRLAIHKPMLAELNDTFGPSSYWGIALVQQNCYSLRWYQTCYSLTHTTTISIWYRKTYSSLQVLNLLNYQSHCSIVVSILLF